MSDTSTPTALPTPAELNKDTRVFRQYQSIPPTASVLNAFNTTTSTKPSLETGAGGTGDAGKTATQSLKAAIAAGGSMAATVMGAGAGSIEEDPPSYNPTYPYNTVLAETESGHLIEVDDSPGAERVHVYHRSGSHIEMRPDGGVKYKTVKKRQDVTIGDNEVMISGDCNIVVEGGYTLHVRKGELIIEAKDDAAISVKGKLKISAENIEMKAKNKIFLNAPNVDIGGISPGGTPMLSLPSGVTVKSIYPPDPTFVPKINLPLSPTGLAKLTAALPKTINAIATTSSSMIAKAISTALTQDAVDAAGELAFSKLAEQPAELPLSHPALYIPSSATPFPLVYQKMRGRALDTPEDVGNFESYNAHINLSVELGDITKDQKTAPGTILQSDTATPADEPHPPLAFPLASGGRATCTANTTQVLGVGTKFTEDVLEKDTIRVNGVDAIVQSIVSDTELTLTQGWNGPTGTSDIHVYRLRPMREFFGKFTYRDSDPLGASGLSLGQLMVNFTSPVIEVPQIKAGALVPGGTPTVDSDCGWTPDQTPGGTGPFAWTIPVGVDISTESLEKEICAEVLRITGFDPRTSPAASLTKYNTTFNLSYWVGKAQHPELFSDYKWRVGWNGYWASRIENWWNTGDTANGDVSRAGAKGIILGSEHWPTCGAGSAEDTSNTVPYMI